MRGRCRGGGECSKHCSPTAASRARPAHPGCACIPSSGSPPPGAGSAVASARPAAVCPGAGRHRSSGDGRGHDASAKRCRLDQERHPSRPRHQLAERRQQDTIGRPQTRPPNLAPQHLQLMPQHQDLKLLLPLRTTKQNQQLEQTADDPVTERQALKQQTSGTHLPTLPARTTPSYSSPRFARGRSDARVSGTHRGRSLPSWRHRRVLRKVGGPAVRRGLPFEPASGAFVPSRWSQLPCPFRRAPDWRHSRGWS